MKMFASRFVLAMMLLPSAAALAAPLPAPLRAEVNGLLDHLQSSGCQFNRNGSWYAAGEARAHLQSKLEYLEGKDAIHSTEQFIELGASTSSVSGKPYQVRCAGKPTVNSKDWLIDALKTQRSANTSAKSTSGSSK